MKVPQFHANLSWPLAQPYKPVKKLNKYKPPDTNQATGSIAPTQPHTSSPIRSPKHNTQPPNNHSTSPKEPSPQANKDSAKVSSPLLQKNLSQLLQHKRKRTVPTHNCDRTVNEKIQNITKY